MIKLGKVFAFLMACAAASLAVFAPWYYLLGILTSYVPSYIFLFKKAITKVEERNEETPMTLKRRKDESFAMYLTRQVVLRLTWFITCTLLWWVFLFVSLSQKSTEDFIDGFAEEL